MTGPRIGELFAGYGGLGMGVQAVLGGSIAWVSEFDKGANKILAHRFPGIPNHGDITKIDWATVEPVDILTGGSPCQDLSHAGKRQGMTEGTRSNLWVAMREAIAALRPGLIVWENVRGAYSAEASSELESDPRLLDSVRRRDGEPVLRALGRVLGDLSDLGYDARWHGLRAGDVGAPHGRFRVFVVAYPQHDGPPARTVTGGAGESQDEGRLREPQGQSPDPPMTLLGTPTARDGKGVSADQPRLEKAAARGKVEAQVILTAPPTPLLPTPRAREMEETVDSFADRQERMADAGRTRGDSGMPLSVAITLLPTPNPFHAGNTESPEEWRARRLDVFQRTGTRHGPSLNVVAWSIAEGNPLNPEHYMPDEEGDPPTQPPRRLLPTPDTLNGVERDAAHQVATRHSPGLDAIDQLLPSTPKQPTKTKPGDDPGALLFSTTDVAPSSATLLPTPNAGQGSSLRTGSDSDYSDLGRTIGRMLPTPTGGDSVGTGYATEWEELTQAEGRHRLRDATNVHAIKQEWGQYAAAIDRWESLTRPVPEPTEPGPKGPRLSPAFSEWMMGLPTGWVTDVPGVTRNEALKALGNGVVPAQAEVALRFLLRGDASPSAATTDLLPTPRSLDATGVRGVTPKSEQRRQPPGRSNADRLCKGNHRP